MKHSGIAIGELSQRTACNIETIRYYERIGLLPSPERQGRYRRYGPEDVQRLTFVRRARPGLHTRRGPGASGAISNRRWYVCRGESDQHGRAGTSVQPTLPPYRTICPTSKHRSPAGQLDLFDPLNDDP
jgi:hypothetical protein